MRACTLARLWGAAALSAAAPAVPLRAEAVLRAERAPDRLVIRIDGELFTEYRFAADQKYPYFYPVVGPLSGASVTTESCAPYPHHHSLFLGCDRVNGGNYWQEGNERGQILQRELTLDRAEGDAIVFHTRNEWARPGAPSPLADRRAIRVTAPATALRVIDFGIRLTALEEVVIEETNHSLFSARVAPELAVTRGGMLINAEGARGEQATFGARSTWMDYAGQRGGVTEGLAILDHPRNRWSPPPWFTRDYGFFSPTPMFWLEGDRLLIGRGDSIELHYRVVVHGGTAVEAGIAEIYRDWAAAPPPAGAPGE